MRLLPGVLFCVAIAFLSPSTSRACISSPRSHFAAPTYIDPDYKPLEGSYVKYDRRTMFNMLLNEYVRLDATLPSVKDDTMREISSRDEADFHAAYLRGAAQFHAQHYDSALTVFQDLRVSASPQLAWWEKLFGVSGYSWAREASSYMVARCQLIISQDRFDGYWKPIESVDQEMLRSADSSYLAYLAEYPEGLYARSARDIRRKIFFLSGQQSELDQDLKRVMLEHFPASNKTESRVSVYKGIVDEFLLRFRGEVDFARDSPVLTAYAWLGPQEPNPQDLIALEARKGDFKAYPGLFRYVRALGLYRLGCFQELLDKTPEEPAEKSAIWLSTQLLRARALAKVGDSTGARAALEKMQAISAEDAVTLELGILLLNGTDGFELFRYSSPVHDNSHLRVFATFGIADEELEAGLAGSDIPGDTRQMLNHELARRYVLSGRFKELVNLLGRERVVPFTGATAIFARLATDPHDITALVDLGEFLYENYITPGFGNALADLMPRCVPCAEFDTRTDSYTPPLTLFSTAVELARESHQRSEAEAKALHYIVLSERPGRWRQQCTWSSRPVVGANQMTGKQAFERLHKLYENSPWAVNTPYYY